MICLLVALLTVCCAALALHYRQMMGKYKEIADELQTALNDVLSDHTNGGAA